ncbi:hypothetical protein [Streptomyces sp. NPDC050422]|uniref:hypothetical protein n=1 Tax=Streptomyces sp. NPDC050422 TaxID=3365614 RepID=UPI00378E4B8C
MTETLEAPLKSTAYDTRRGAGALRAPELRKPPVCAAPAAPPPLLLAGEHDADPAESHIWRGID